MHLAEERLPVTDWVGAVERCTAGGHVLLDVYTAVDHGDRVELVLRLSAASGADVRLLVTDLDPSTPEVATLVPTLPAAAWHEREMAEMFGIRFAGHPDPRPLLLRDPSPTPPLRRSTPLDRRVATPWPGADGTDGRRARRPRVPGVRDEWLGEGTR